jgi:serine/threonine-protein kinase
LAFHERKPNGERDIWVVTEGNDPYPFLLTPFDERSPRFSPNGRWLAYVSDESGRDDVYVQPFPGPGPKWLVSTDGGIDPVWSRDGRELFYRRDDQMMVVSVAPGIDFSAGRPRRLFEFHFDNGDNGPNYDVSRDGTYFVMPKSDQTPASVGLQLVLNWFGEITSRAPTHAANRPTQPPASRSPWSFIAATLLAAEAQQGQPSAADAGVRDTLQRYSAALESLDASAVKKVQPSIPADTLAKAFNDMRELKVMIDDIRVLSLDGTSARVSCRVTQTLTPKVGSKKTTAVTRVMRLKRATDAWVIDRFER